MVIDITYLYLGMIFMKAFAALWATTIVAVAAFGVTWVAYHMTKTFIQGYRK